MEAKKNGPQNAETPQHACFPNLAHESRGDRSLISDARSQELQAAAGTTSAPASAWKEAIKHPSRAWNAKCLQLGRGRLASRAAHHRHPLCSGCPLCEGPEAPMDSPGLPLLPWGHLLPGTGWAERTGAPLN